ncbi:MAG: hypothetical protein E7423_04455 [Ruminococcaceae bacterium]|nr:hypothetical protein [Oscillospiraceae bacterium]
MNDKWVSVPVPALGLGALAVTLTLLCREMRALDAARVLACGALTSSSLMLTLGHADAKRRAQLVIFYLVAGASRIGWLLARWRLGLGAFALVWGAWQAVTGGFLLLLLIDVRPRTSWPAVLGWLEMIRLVILQ